MISNFKWIAVCSTISSALGIYSLVSYIQYAVVDSIQKNMNVIHTTTDTCDWTSGTNGITSDNIFQTIKNNNEHILKENNSRNPDMPKLTIIIPTNEQTFEYTPNHTPTSESSSGSSAEQSNKYTNNIEADVEADENKDASADEDEDEDEDEHMYECFANIAESMTHSSSVIDISSQPPIEHDYVPVNSKPTGDTTLHDVLTSLWGANTNVNV